MNSYLVTFAFSASPQNDLHSYSEIEAESEVEAISIAEDILHLQFPRDAGSIYSVKAECQRRMQ